MSEINQLDTAQKPGNGRKVLIALSAVFILPFTIAALLHFLDIRPSGKSFGNLVTPPVSLAIPALIDGKSKIFAANNWQKKWNIVVIEHSACEISCQEKIDLVSKVQTSLNKDIERVQRILILPTEKNINLIATLQNKFPDLIILTENKQSMSQFLSKFEVYGQPHSIYLVDPLGNLMMNYPQDFKPRELRGDLVRLLKNSWAG